MVRVVSEDGLDMFDASPVPVASLDTDPIVVFFGAANDGHIALSNGFISNIRQSLMNPSAFIPVVKKLQPLAVFAPIGA